MFRRHIIVIALLGAALLGARSAEAGWAVSSNYAGYQGESAFGVAYVGASRRWNVDLLAGFTELFTSDSQMQYTLKYQRWLLPVNKSQITWFPLTLGAFLTYTPDDRYFILTPDHYNQWDYYQPTAIHLGFTLGTGLDFTIQNQPFRAYVESSWLDRYLIMAYNNRDSINLMDYVGMGAGLKWTWR